MRLRKGAKLLTQFKTLLHGNYKAAFNEAVTDIIAEDIVDRGERILAVRALIDAYVDSVGETPDDAQLERLTDYILREELTDMHPDKVTNTEYPFMSDWQLELRRDRETSLKVAEETGTDGRDYREPKRRRRTGYENWHVDTHAKIRNRERAAQYKRDTGPGPIVPYRTEEFVQCRSHGVNFTPEYYR